MYKFFLAVFSIFAAVSLTVGTYLGLAMGGLAPIPFDPHGDWIIGVAPVTLGALGIIFIFLACQNGSRLVVRGWRDVDPVEQDHQDR